MNVPTWKSVGVPQVVANAVAALPASFGLDSLVYQFVYHNQKRVSLTYACNNCGHVYVPQRASEEVCQCGRCHSRQVRCVQSLKFGSKVPQYSRTGQHLRDVMRQMCDNFQGYFGFPADRDIDWEWHGGMYHVAFAGGDTAHDPSPRMAVVRAAVLVPYLWDSGFNWKDLRPGGAGEQGFISHILGQLAVRKQ